MGDLIGIVSDAHGNVHAFRKVLNHLDGIGVNRYLFLGDAIGYLPSCAVLDEISLRQSQFRCVRGNHEQMLIEGDVQTHNEDVYQLGQVASCISDENLLMIKSWPTQINFSLGGIRILMQHGSPQNSIWGYVYPDSELKVVENLVDLVLVGNTHLPFLRKHGRTLWLNPGSCGLPRDDGRFASAAILSASPLEIEILRVNVVDETARSLDECRTVHDSTKSIFRRRSRQLVGRIVV
jgi:putative phosphoesterase